jgi:hypothetical protein
VAAIALVGVGVSALDAKPSITRDVEHYRQVLQEVSSSDLDAALNGCFQGSVTQGHTALLASVRHALAQPAFTPSTTAVRAAHLSLVHAVDACLAGDQAGFQRQLGTFAEQARTLGLIA